METTGQKGGDAAKAYFRARALQREYMALYSKRPFCSEAFAAGWGLFLWQWVSAVAWLQAQFIAGVKNVGYDYFTIFQSIRKLRPESEDIKNFLRAQEDQAWTGNIQVTVPDEIIPIIKKKAEFMKEMNKTGEARA